MATSLFGNMGGLDQTALDFAKLSPTQQSAYLIGSGARGAAEGIGGLMGMQTKQKQMQNLMQQYNVTTSQGLRDLANAIRNTDPQGALSLIAKADEMDLAQAKTQSEQAQTFQRMQAGYKSQVETTKPPSVGPTAELIAQGEYNKPFNELTPEQKKDVAQKASGSQGKKFDDTFARAAMDAGIDLGNRTTYGEFTADEQKRILASMQKAKEESPLAAIQRQLVQARVDAMNATAEEKAAKKEDEKRLEITSLATAESQLEDNIITGLQAKKIAPTSMLGAIGYIATKDLPWNDNNTLKGLTETLQSAKVLNTLQQLKTQSRTGATGFGPLSDKELGVLQADIRKLDPASSNFKENLDFVLKRWNRTREALRQRRLELTGKSYSPKVNNDIEATMKANPGMDRLDVIIKLREKGFLND